MTEVWRPVRGQPGYEVSSHGRVRSWKPERNFAPVPKEPRILRRGTDKDGYRKVRLYQNGKCKDARVCALVCEAWHGPRPEGNLALHRNGINSYDRPGNLYWGTALENSADSLQHGTRCHGEQVRTAVLTEDDVREIKGRAGTHAALAAEYGVSPGAIWQIRAGRTWKHVE